MFAQKTCATITMLSFAVLASCTSVGESLSQAVFIEYDQRVNFQHFAFATAVIAPEPPQGNPTEWNEISVNDMTGTLGKRGVWIVYQVCSIRNNGSLAKPFPYDISKFYVVYNSKRFYQAPLALNTYSNTGDLQGNENYNPAISKRFILDTQVGPTNQVIDVNFCGTLSIAWRFVIYVSTDGSDQTDLVSLNLPLHYDGSPVDLISRNYDTEPHYYNSKVTGASLPTVCRPKQ
jgi:hypothetical protein